VQLVPTSGEEEILLHDCQDEMLEFLGSEGPCSMLRWKSKANSAVKVRKCLFTEKKKERLHMVMQWDLETGGPLS
jgi:hypothetical protein